MEAIQEEVVSESSENSVDSLTQGEGNLTMAELASSLMQKRQTEETDTTEEESEPVAQQKKPVKSQKPLDISRRDAIRKVKSQYRGKVLKAESTRVKGRSGYRIKMLSGEGVIFYIYVDATSGRVRKRSR